MEKIKVLIADDHCMFLRGIESILAEDETLQVVGKAQNGKEAYELTKEFAPDVILMDVNMPHMDGVQALKMITQEMPKVKVLMLTTDEHGEQLIEALRYGAKGYLLKNLLPNELLTFIHMANRGESVVYGHMIGKFIGSIPNMENTKMQKVEIPKNVNILTRREREILLKVIKGMTNREIAEALLISENTVKNHLRNIMEKLQMNNRIQAATYAMKEGWLQEI